MLVVHLDEELLGLFWVCRHERVVRILSHVFELCNALIHLLINHFLLQFFVIGVIRTLLQLEFTCKLSVRDIEKTIGVLALFVRFGHEGVALEKFAVHGEVERVCLGMFDAPADEKTEV